MPIIAMLFNIAAGTWHPILFLNHLLPGGKDGSRYKSKMHHTGGFATQEEANADATTNFAPRVREYFGEPRMMLDRVLEWDGDGIPAMVVLFDEQTEALIIMS